MKWSWFAHTLEFKVPGGTSRGVLQTKTSYFFTAEPEPGVRILGECGLLAGLSADDRPTYSSALNQVVEELNDGTYHYESWRMWPSLQFGVEMALSSLVNYQKGFPLFEYFPSLFTSGKASIPINGLIWMGTLESMKAQISSKLNQGFSCLKLKIGALAWSDESALLKEIRKQFGPADLELRVDANGGFTPENVGGVLNELAQLGVHSIEQPLQPQYVDELATWCSKSPVPIALDESLIGKFTLEEKESLLNTIKPPYIILKPSFIGGWQGTTEWIDLARKHGIKWWITSALESNLGLNAIAQYTYMQEVSIPQGLGTGGLFTNNVDAPLLVKKGNLWYQNHQPWNLNVLERKSPG